MNNLFYIFIVWACLVLSVNRPVYGQEVSYNAMRHKPFSSTARENLHLTELIELHKASNKVLSSKELYHYYGDDSYNWVSIIGYTSLTDTSSVKSNNDVKTKNRLKGAFVGGLIGGLTGYVLGQASCVNSFL